MYGEETNAFGDVGYLGVQAPRAQGLDELACGHAVRRAQGAGVIYRGPTMDTRQGLSASTN